MNAHDARATVRNRGAEMSQFDNMIQSLLAAFQADFAEQLEGRQPAPDATTAQIITWINQEGAKHPEHFEGWPRRREFNRVAVAHRIKMEMVAALEAQLKAVQEQAVEAYALFDQYQRSKSENTQLRIVRKLYFMGFKIRPMLTIVATDEAHATVLNEGSQEMGLHSITFGLPVPRPVVEPPAEPAEPAEQPKPSKPRRRKPGE
jgi:hypothetical protein